MARGDVPIGEYTSQVPVQEGLRRIIPERSGISTGPGLEAVGDSVQKIVQSEAANYSLQTLSQTQSDWTKKLIDSQQSAAPGAPGFTPTLMGQYNDYVKDAVKGAPSAMAGRVLNQQLTQFGHQLSQKALLFEANARQDHNEQTAKDSIEATGNELMLDPTVYQQRLDERLAGIGAMNMDPDVKDKLSDYAQKSLSRFAVQGDINRDPYNAMLNIQNKDPQGYYKNLTPEQRDQLMDTADLMLHQRVADAERVHNLAKQQQEDASDGLLKQGIVMSTKGQLTPDWVVSHASTLQPAALKYLLDDSSGKKTDSDLHVYADLLNRVGQGQDVRDDATSALFAGQLSKEDYARITDKASGELPNSYKRGLQYIQTAGKTSELEPDPAKTTTLANMQNDFQDWVNSNPKASPEDTQKQAVDIVRRYQLVRADQNMLTLPVPQHFVGTRVQPDVQGSKQSLFQAFQDGQINKDDFDREAALLQKWQAATLAASQKAAAAKAKQNQ